MYQEQVYELGIKWMYWVYVQVYALGIGTRCRYKYEVLSVTQWAYDNVQVLGISIIVSSTRYGLGIGAWIRDYVDALGRCIGACIRYRYYARV